MIPQEENHPKLHADELKKLVASSNFEEGEILEIYAFATDAKRDDTEIPPRVKQPPLPEIQRLILELDDEDWNDKSKEEKKKIVAKAMKKGR